MKKLKNIALAISASVGAFMFFLVGSVHAAADTDFASGTALMTGVITDNKSQMISYIAGILVVVTIVGLIIKALFFGKGQALSIFGGKRKSRR